MRIFKKYGAFLCFLILFIVINLGMSFALRPFSGSGSEMWRGFANKGQIDMVYTGTSFCLCDIDPALVDAETGLKSYNMGTNMQSIQSSYIALKEAIERGGITKAIVGIDPEIMEMNRQDNFRAEACFVRNLSDTLSPAARVKAGANFVTSKDFIGTPSSVLYYFPWTYDRVSNIPNNIREKLQSQILDMTDHRDENGHYGSDEMYGEGRHFLDLTSVVAWNNEVDDLYYINVRQDNLDTLEDIAKLCKANDVELFVIAFPTTQALSVYRLDSYRDYTDTVKALLSGYGYEFYDYTLAKEEYVDVFNLEIYRDNGHLNNAGTEQFSRALGIMVNKYEAGEDVTEMFYDLPAYEGN
ncbi:hypothetical protein D6855_10235 [Butyrivibrio sp. CB08]|uniref:hypothetical protein n=1 Tax=Butyrivibrio sp. CB08 TaxID=2364879 RepID=UPI000EAA6706|nr:hypothetical protein [Butyrivibrio sp. CB08]RKM59273.1 hypothetical protein D6855_10235 [Butyrivibrio sp. CB08]